MAYKSSCACLSLMNLCIHGHGTDRVHAYQALIILAFVLIVITSIHICIREFCMCADQINRTLFQVVSQGNLIHLIFNASTQSNAKISTTHYH